MEEIWKTMVYRGEKISRLLVSDRGNIKNKITGKLLKLNTSKKGYKNVTISLNSDKLNIKAHRAVAETFINNPNGFPMVNHIDGDKSNNKVENLEWCTNKMNISHAIAEGLIKPYENAQTKKIKSLEDGQEYFSIGEAARAYSDETRSSITTRKNISRALVNGGTAYGMTWIYIDFKE